MLVLMMLFVDGAVAWLQGCSRTTLTARSRFHMLAAPTKEILEDILRRGDDESLHLAGLSADEDRREMRN
jgi:hypothetical protein